MRVLLLVCVLVRWADGQCFSRADNVRRVTDQGHQSLLHSQLQFSTDLLHTVSTLQTKDNVLVSPTSIFSALLMIYFMSANKTGDTLRKALHLDSEQDKLDVYGAYSMERYYQKIRSVVNKKSQQSCVNRVWYARGLKVRGCMKVLFSDELTQADFEHNSGSVVRRINQWVESWTNHNIKDFLSEDSVTPDTQLVLVNAAYFKGSWKLEFEEADTRPVPFHLTNGSVVNIPMMTQQSEFKSVYDEKLGVESVELPYLGDDVCMFVLLPLKNSVSAVHDVVKQLNADSIKKLVQDFNSSLPERMQVTVPKFTVEESLELKEVLQSMGVGDIFGGSSDLSTLSPSNGLGFSEALHKAKIRVDEKGTEAAAATDFIAARMGINSFVANRPFIYIIYDKVSNIILFYGILRVPPTKES